MTGPLEKKKDTSVFKEEAPKVETVSKKELAVQAVTALRDFVLTRNVEKKNEFLQIWNSNTDNEFTSFFNEQFVEQMRVYTDKESDLHRLVAAHLEKIGSMDPAEFAGAVHACYIELAKPEAERDKEKLAGFGEPFVSSLQSIAQKAMIVVPKRVDTTDLKLFLKLLGAKEGAGPSEKDMMLALVKAVREKFEITDFADAQHLTKALLHSFTSLDTQEDKNWFQAWLRQVDKDQAAALAGKVDRALAVRGMTLPYEAVQESFEQWKQAKLEKMEEISALEHKLDGYATSIKEGSIRAMAAEFEKNPSLYSLGRLITRAEYVYQLIKVLETKKDKGEEIRKLKGEIALLISWLKKLGLDPSPEKGFAKLQAGLNMIKEHYVAMEPEKANLVDYVDSVAPNKALFAIYKRYLSRLDKESVEIFTQENPDSPDYLANVNIRIRGHLTSEKVNRGRAQWYEDYYKLLAPADVSTQQGAAQAQAYNRVANLDPLTAVAFFDYLAEVKRVGIDTVEERRAVVQTLSNLYALSPLLAVKYFAAIRNLASVCSNHPEIFREALTHLAARIDAEVQPITSGVSPMQILPLNVVKIIDRLDKAFEDISNIPKASMAQFERLRLLDDRLTLESYPPHVIRQKPAGYAPNLLVPRDVGGGYFPPYFLPPVLVTPTPNLPFTGGSVLTAPPQYGGAVTLPSFAPLQVYSGATAVGTAFHYYIHPEHPLVSIQETIPGVDILGLSATRLMMEIDRAFIPTEEPDYSKQVIAGGGAAGVAGQKEEEWKYGGGGLGAVITPTGGGAFGGAQTPDRFFAGAAAVAVPIGIPIISPAMGKPGMVTGIDSMVGGYESLDDGTKRALLRALQTAWNPSNPTQTIVAVNHEETSEGKRFMTARYFYVEKDGTIFEVKGGMNDFVETLNFAAGYVNQTLDEPATYVWNVEPTIDRGGGAVTFDAGKTATLVHAQAVPFFTLEYESAFKEYETTITSGDFGSVPQDLRSTLANRLDHKLFSEDDKKAIVDGKQLELNDKQLKNISNVTAKQPQPFLLEWTPAEAVTVVSKDKETTYVHMVALPGKMLKLKPGRDGSESDDYIVQDSEYMLRSVKDTNRWELRLGFGAGDTPTGTAYKGGFFLKTEEAKASAGGGIFYEAGATNLEAIAVMQNAEDARAYIESLHRVSETIYGQKETANRILMGGLAQIVEQIKEEKDAETGEKKTKYDNTFWRLVGILKGMESTSGVKIDLSRFQGLDTLMADYEGMSRAVAENPERADAEISDFQAKYAEKLEQVFDYYSLAVQVKKDLSIEAIIMNSEDGGKWTSQTPTNVYSRVLYTWKTGFWRAFASIPVMSSSGVAGESTATGVVGTGIGQDLFNGLFLQRVAADAGLLVARHIEGDNEWQKAGWFVQAAAKVFSNVAEDTEQYRVLVKDYEQYEEYVRQGRFSRLPESVRKVIAENVSKDVFPEALRQKVADGVDLGLTNVQTSEALDALWDGWFYEKKYELNQKFNGHMRAFLGASGYVFDDRTYWDIAAFLEHVENFRMYAIVAKREKLGIYAGFDARGKAGKGQVRGGAMGGVDTSGAWGAATSLGYQFGSKIFPMEVGIYGYGRNTTVPDYTYPLLDPRTHAGMPEFGVMLYFTIGLGLQGPGALNLTPSFPTTGTGNY